MTDINKDVYCPMIHGGLSINLSSHPGKTAIKHCCIIDQPYIFIDNQTDPWSVEQLTPLRELNLQGQWHSSCWACERSEKANISSYRTGMLEKFGVKENLPGPIRLDLMFDTSCNLACRTCGPSFSTYWQKHLKDNHIKIESSIDTKTNEMIDILKRLDLTNLEMVSIAGGESLMSKSYWQVAEFIADSVPNAKEKLTLSFQTNGTQPIEEKYYSIIEKFQLIKIHFSIDAIDDQFEYLRWPAKWEQVTKNMYKLRDSLPVNVMFLIEETISIFNLYYHDKLSEWIKNNFSTNRLGDAVNHSSHPAQGIYSLDNLSQRYINVLDNTPLSNLIPKYQKENSANIKLMIAEIRKFDTIRGQDFTKTFPEIAEFYSEYLR